MMQLVRKAPPPNKVQQDDVIINVTVTIKTHSHSELRAPVSAAQIRRTTCC